MTNYIDQANTLFNLVSNKNAVSVDDIRSLCLTGNSDELYQEQNRVLKQCDDAEFSAYSSLMKFSQFIAKHNPSVLYKVNLRINTVINSQLKHSKKTCPVSSINDIEANGVEYHMDHVYFSVLSESEQLELAMKLSKSA